MTRSHRQAILGVNGWDHAGSHDASAALLVGGVIDSAAEEERFTRKRHAFGSPPHNSIRFCVGHASLTPGKSIVIARGAQDFETGKRSGRALSDTVLESDACNQLILPEWWPDRTNTPILHVKHHVAHLAAAYYTSGFRDAACLIIDGQGEEESITLAEMKGHELRILRTYPISLSLGHFYGSVAEYSGLGYNNGGKLMGLAPYGTAFDPGWVRVDPRTGEIDVGIDRSGLDGPNVDGRRVSEVWGKLLGNQAYPFDARGEDGNILDYANLAATAQKELENAIVGLAQHLRAKSRSSNLILGGGVALNCSANSRVATMGLFDRTFIYPASNDAGVSLGAALEVARVLGHPIDATALHETTAFLGPDTQEIPLPARDQATMYHVDLPSEPALLQFITSALVENRVVAWYRGRAEFGPRALGARSLLVHPGYRSNLIRLNKIKGRELWRPLAPSILIEDIGDVFDTNGQESLYRFMLGTATVRPTWVRRIPAVIHVDGTSRPQGVASNAGAFRRLIELFKLATGLPLIVNTSFNVGGQPIVNSPSDAIETFSNTPGIDYLVLGNRLLTRESWAKPASVPSSDSLLQ